LSFKHHAELCSIDDPAVQDRFLSWCEETIEVTGEPRSTRALLAVWTEAERRQAAKEIADRLGASIAHDRHAAHSDRAMVHRGFAARTTRARPRPVVATIWWKSASLLFSTTPYHCPWLSDLHVHHPAGDYDSDGFEYHCPWLSQTWPRPP
jgi:hypothetical protein